MKLDDLRRIQKEASIVLPSAPSKMTRSLVKAWKPAAKLSKKVLSKSAGLITVVDDGAVKKASAASKGAKNTTELSMTWHCVRSRVYKEAIKKGEGRWARQRSTVIGKKNCMCNGEG